MSVNYSYTDDSVSIYHPETNELTSHYSTMENAMLTLTKQKDLTLIKKIIEQVDIDEGDYDSALEYAMDNNYTEAIVFFINEGADVPYNSYKKDKANIYNFLENGGNIFRLGRVQGIEELITEKKKIYITISLELYNCLPKELVHIVMEYYI